ncbi:M48 family metallopeptidase [Phytomonospora sp. NPDC050363]|uniref:M48 family metallopeptidase n=1 Tax=Phytomonospora sp. NPDC050363 TaxID=3155642 RepID=UPI0033F1AD48
MSRGTAVRAAIALGLLAGFYVYALAWAVGIGLLALWAVRSFGVVLSLPVTVGCGVVAFGVLGGLLASLRKVPFEPGGRPLGRGEAPELWEFVEETARLAGTRPPDEIHLDEDVNAWVCEVGGLLGLLPGTRHLMIGLPFLSALPRGELRAIVAHECGHYVGHHTRLGPVTHRAQLAIGRVGERLRRQWWNPLAWPLVPYAVVFGLVATAVSRRQELEADRAAAGIAGADAMRAALRALRVVGAGWDFYLGAYVSHGLPHGLVPKGVLTGFQEMWDHRREFVARLETGLPIEPPGVFDTHPHLGVRLKALDGLPAEGTVDDEGEARDLLPATLWEACDGLVVDLDGRERVEWAAFTTRSYAAVQREIAEDAYRFLANETGVNPPTLTSVLWNYERGRGEALLAKLAGPLFPSHGLAAIVLSAAYDSDALYYAHHWGGALRLMRQGVRLSAAVGEPVTDPTPTGGFDDLAADVTYRDTDWDMAVTVHGLLLIPFEGRQPPKGLSETGRPYQRLRELVGRNSPLTYTRHETLWLPYAHWTSAHVENDKPLRLTFETRDGARHTLGEHYAPMRFGEPARLLRTRLAAYGIGR